MRSCFSLEVKGEDKCTQCETSPPRKLKAEVTWCWIQAPDFAPGPLVPSPFSLLVRGEVTASTKPLGEQRTLMREESQLPLTPASPQSHCSVALGFRSGLFHPRK